MRFRPVSACGHRRLIIPSRILLRDEHRDVRMCISPDQTKLMAVARAWSMCGGAVSLARRSRSTARELVEEVGLDLDETFEPRFMGGYQEASSATAHQRRLLGDRGARSPRLQADGYEISECRWLPWARMGSRYSQWTAGSTPPEEGAKGIELDFAAWGRDDVKQEKQVLTEAHPQVPGPIKQQVHATTKTERLEFGYIFSRPPVSSVAAQLRLLRRPRSVVCFGRVHATVDGVRYLMRGDRIPDTLRRLKCSDNNNKHVLGTGPPPAKSSAPRQ